MDDSLMNELSAVRGERDGLKADRDKLQTELKEAQSKLEAVAKEVTALTEQLKTATDQVTKFEEAAKHIAHKEQVAKEITEAGLDNKLNPAVVSIIESLDADKRKVMLEEQATVIKAIGSTPGHLPRDPAPAKTDSKGWDVEKFASQFVK
jgi:predicted  nucleic acid-binding Zn-ribbon protein